MTILKFIDTDGVELFRTPPGQWEVPTSGEYIVNQNVKYFVRGGGYGGPNDYPTHEWTREGHQIMTITLKDYHEGQNNDD